MKGPWRAVLVVGCIVAASAAGTRPVVAEPTRSTTGAEIVQMADGESAQVQALAAKKMVDDYGITMEDALDQLARQDAANTTATSMAKAVPSLTWAGAYIDHADHGALVALATEPIDKLALGSALVPYRVRTVERSLAELEKIKASLEAAKDQRDLAVMISIDIRTNRVELRPIGKQGASQAAEIDELARAQGGGAVVADSVSAMSTTSCDSTYQWCDPELRGGIAMFSQSSINCTAGFIVRSNTDDKPYVLTAGHCPVEANVSNWRSKWVSDAPTLHTIGGRHSYEYGTYTSSTLDTAIIDINDATTWDPAPWVLVKASAMTTLNEQYSMSGVGSTAGLAQYTYLCTTGGVSATRCGQYYASGVDGLDGVRNTAWVGFGSCSGDSGGPVYKSHLGYGTVHAQLTAGSSTSLNAGFGSFTGTCGTSSLYQGLSGALAAMNVHLDT